MATIRRFASAAGGAVLAGATGALASVRRARKPLHPAGEVLAGRIHRRGGGAGTPRTGVPWLDEPGADDVEVRRSRAIGLPPWLPDIHGLAVRVHADGGVGDLLFATTGRGRVTRFVLTACWRDHQRPMTTLLPYETDGGPVLLCAAATGELAYELSWAGPSGDWHAFGDLRLSTDPGDDVGISFDPIARQLPGLRQYPSVVRLREPAYLRARRSRGQDQPTREENAHVQ